MKKRKDTLCSGCQVGFVGEERWWCDACLLTRLLLAQSWLPADTCRSTNGILVARGALSALSLVLCVCSMVVTVDIFFFYRKEWPNMETFFAH